jgi:dihydroorotate dehydrogenase electron transfer subunit
MLALDPETAHRDPLLARPMAVYRGDASALEFRFKVVGRGTRILGSLPVGAPLGVVGPLGNGFPDLPAGSVLVGGGTGIASLYELAARDSHVRVLLGGATRNEVLGLDDFEALGVELQVATEDGSRGRRGLVTDLLQPEPDRRVVACGPTPMMRVAAELAQKAGASCLVSLESPMACGFGICLGCAVPTRDGFRYVCTDGPVFDAAEIRWEELA